MLVQSSWLRTNVSYDSRLISKSEISTFFDIVIVLSWYFFINVSPESYMFLGRWLLWSPSQIIIFLSPPYNSNNLQVWVGWMNLSSFATMNNAGTDILLTILIGDISSISKSAVLFTFILTSPYTILNKKVGKVI